MQRGRSLARVQRLHVLDAKSRLRNLQGWRSGQNLNATGFWFTFKLDEAHCQKLKRQTRTHLGESRIFAMAKIVMQSHTSASNIDSCLILSLYFYELGIFI